MCLGSSSPPPAPLPPEKVFVPVPDYRKVQIPEPSKTKAMLANTNKQGTAARARDRLKRSERGPSSLRIVKPTYN